MGQSKARGQVLRISMKIVDCVTAEKFLTSFFLYLWFRASCFIVAK